MARQLEKLPRWGYAYYLDTPGWNGKMKRISDPQGFHPRRKGRLPLKDEEVPTRRMNSGISYRVSCTICLDAGCDMCPTIEEE
jgi:hypothetical protein